MVALFVCVISDIKKHLQLLDNARAKIFIIITFECQLFSGSWPFVTYSETVTECPAETS